MTPRSRDATSFYVRVFGQLGWWQWLWFWLWLSACAPNPGELSPSQALHAFLVALDRSMHAPEQLKAAYEWVDVDSQQALKQRAELAAALAGREVAPWDMLVPGRSSFSSYGAAPASSMRARIEGERAWVSVPLEGARSVEVPLVRQDGRWRVKLGLDAGS